MKRNGWAVAFVGTFVICMAAAAIKGCSSPPLFPNQTPTEGELANRIINLRELLEHVIIKDMSWEAEAAAATGLLLDYRLQLIQGELEEINDHLRTFNQKLGTD